MYRVITNTPSKMPKIVKITVSEVSSTGYRVTAQFEASRGVSKVLMPTWTEANGQDDLVWHQASVSQNTATCYIRTSDHKNEYGTYVTHVYVYDADGDFALEGTYVPLDQNTQNGYTGLLLRDGKWKYYQNGALEENYIGLVSNGGSWYYVERAEVNWNYTGLIYYEGSWYYVRAGVVDWLYTGLCLHDGAWYYIKNGLLDWSYTGLCFHSKVWYYIKNGQVNWNYTGPCQYNGECYYVENGVLNWSHDLNNDSGKTYASILVEPDVDNQKAAAILEEKAIMIEEDHAQPTVLMAQSEPEVKMPLQSEMPSEADITLPVQSDKQQIELNWFVIIVKTFLSYIKECIGM